MKLEDFNTYEQNQRMYGGSAGRKMGIIYEGKNYLLKFPGNLKEQHLKNINLSYSNSPVCEYIGSQIYDLIGVPGCIFELHGKRVNPYHIIENMEYSECSDAIQRLTPKIGKCMVKICEMIDEISVLSEIQKQFFILMITNRYEKVFLPSLQKITESQKSGKDESHVY